MHASTHAGFLLGLAFFYDCWRGNRIFFALQWASLILCDAPVVQQEDLFISTSGSGKSLVTVDVKALVLFYGH